jgi:hypothetical protein
MSMVRINWHPSAAELRKFGVAMLVGFGLIGGLFFWKQMPTTAAVCWVFGAVAGVLGLTGTKAAIFVYIPWMAVALVMGNIVSRVLLAVIYYAVFTPMGVIRRLLGRDRLQLRRRQQDTYWVDAPGVTDPAQYERQF